MNDKRNSAFANCHPLVNFTFYLFVIVYTILLNHPFYIAVSFVFSLIYATLLTGKGIIKVLLFMLPMMIMIIILNPLFNHYGTVPPLFYLGDNPVTKEAVMYGVVNAFMLATVLLWFVSYNKIITSEKFIYLFGRIIPKIALILSMALRLIPKMTNQIKVIANAQNMIGKGLRQKGMLHKIKNGLKILSILITWSLDNGIETADSMKARGYGAKHRTSFTVFRMYSRDKIMLPLLIVLAGVCVAGMVMGATFFQYRYLSFRAWSGIDYLYFVAFAMFCMLPIMLEIKEKLKWRYLLSKV